MNHEPLNATPSAARAVSVSPDQLVESVLGELPGIGPLHEAIREGGLSPWQEQLTWKGFADKVLRNSPSDVKQLAAGLEASRRYLGQAVTQENWSQVAPHLQVTLPAAFESPAWKSLHGLVNAHYQRIIEWQLRGGEIEEALRTYERAGKILGIPPTTQQSLARGAAELKKTDLAAARLYVGYLEHDTGTDDAGRRMLELLRRAIRIDLEEPHDGEISARLQLNEQLWMFRAEPWVAAHRAMAAIRSDDLRSAWDHCQSGLDSPDADTDCWYLLGLAAYACRQFACAERCLQQAATADSETSHAAYLALARLARWMAEGPPETTREEWTQQVRVAVTSLEASPQRAVLDAAWVRAAAWFWLGEAELAARALQHAPLERLSWRYGILLRDVSAPEIPSLADQLEVVSNAGGTAGHVAQLLQAQQAHEHFSWREARALIAVLPTVTDEVADGDPQVVKACLEFHDTSVAVAKASPAPVRFGPWNVDLPYVSSAARAFWEQTEVRDRLLHGELTAARQLLEQPCQWIGPPHPVRRLDATCLLLSGSADERIEEILEDLGSLPHAPPIDRLAWGVWLAHRGVSAKAREILEPMIAEFPDCLELRLALAEAELAEGDSDAVLHRLTPSPTTDQVSDERSFWLGPPCHLLGRPWQRRIPAEQWWPLDASPLHRMADMIQGVELLLQATHREPAVRLVETIEQVLGTETERLASTLGELLRKACRLALDQQDLLRGCELHLRASIHGAEDPDFALRMADALEGCEETPADPVMEVLVSGVPKQVAGDRIDESRLGIVLCRVLHIDRDLPTTTEDWVRRRAWTQRLADAAPHWDWPQRNLARDAFRDGRFEEVLSRVEQVREPNGEDHALIGVAAWELEEYQRSHAGFAAACASGKQSPADLGWEAVSGIAARFAQSRTVPCTFEAGQAEAWERQLLDVPEDSSIANQARLWRAALMLGLDQTEHARDILASRFELHDEEVTRRLMEGFALAQLGRTGEALKGWWAELDDVTSDPLTQSLRGLLMVHQGPILGRDVVRRLTRTLRKRQSPFGFFPLLKAHVALGDGQLADIPDLLQAANDSPHPPIILTPLLWSLADERSLVAARWKLASGPVEDARTHLAEVGPNALVPRAVRYWEGILALRNRDLPTAQKFLQPLVDDPADVDGQLAWSRGLLHHGRAEEASAMLEDLRERQPEHPGVVLAWAELQSARGETAEARTTYRSIFESLAEQAGARLCAVARTAAARLETIEGNWERAERELRSARQQCPAYAPATRRLGLVVAATADNEARWREVTEICQAIPRWSKTVLDRAVAAQGAHELGEESVAVEIVRELLARETFSEENLPLRRQIQQWQVPLLLRRKEFAEAVQVAEPLVACGLIDADEQFSWRVGQVLHNLRLIPLAFAQLEQAWRIAEEAHQDRPEEDLPLLLSVLCEGLLGRRSPTQSERLLELKQHSALAHQLKLLAGVARHLAGDDDAVADIQASLERLGGAGVRRDLELLIANQQRRVAPLVERGLELLQGTSGPGPLVADDLTRITALHFAEEKKEQAAIQHLESWHDKGKGSAETRRLHALLLAKKAAEALHAKDLEQGRNLLRKAVLLIQENANVPTVAAVSLPDTPDDQLVTPASRVAAPINRPSVESV